MRNKSNRAVDRFGRLDFYDFENNLLERWKTNVLNKGIGLIMIQRIMEHFNINLQDIAKKEQSELKEELEMQKQVH